MNIGVYGAGKWGMAIDFILNHNISTKIHSRTIRKINNFVSLEKLLEMEYIVISISAQYIHQFLKDNKILPSHKFLIVSKGIDLKSSTMLSEIFAKYTSLDNIAFLSGPSFSSEVIEAKPVALGVFSTNEKLAKEFQNVLNTDFVKTYISDDIIGAQIAGAYKNVIAIASGISDAMGLGFNARAALVSRGLVEMCRFGISYGAKMDTFLGIAGAGDLFLTSSSTLSRNFQLGNKLGKGDNLNNALNDIKETTEGVNSSFAIKAMAKNKNIYTPIVDEVCLIIEGKSPKQSLYDLINNKK
jgi:glycerol-3-phosphate dehydrogenase (NAD(P)+)